MKNIAFFTPLAALAALSLLLLSGCGFSSMGQMAYSPLNLGICGVIILVCNIIFMIEIAGSSQSLLKKILWLAFIWFFPGVGFISYLLFARDDFRNR
jgi:uncharacterized membrane protein